MTNVGRITSCFWSPINEIRVISLYKIKIFSYYINIVIIKSAGKHYQIKHTVISSPWTPFTYTTYDRCHEHGNKETSKGLQINFIIIWRITVDAFLVENEVILVYKLTLLKIECSPKISQFPRHWTINIFTNLFLLGERPQFNNSNRNLYIHIVFYFLLYY